MPEEKSYKSSTGVDGFYYGALQEGSKVAEYIERVKFLQTITVEMPQEVTRAYGDNGTAEMAVSNGDISVTAGFHKIPLEDKQRLLGWQVVDGITATGSKDTPIDVGVIFTKTYENGTCEYVGLPKGLFTRPNLEGKTKEDGVEFSSEEMEGQFMDREVDGFDEEKSVLFAIDKKGETTNRDKLFMLIFGLPHPNAGASEAATAVDLGGASA